MRYFCAARAAAALREDRGLTGKPDQHEGPLAGQRPGACGANVLPERIRPARRIADV